MKIIKQKKFTYTYHCPTCNTTRQLKVDPKYRPGGNIRECRNCAQAKRKRPIRKAYSPTSKLYDNCTRTMTEVSNLTGVSKPTINNIETRAFIKIYDELSDYLKCDKISLSKKKGDPARKAMKRFVMDYFTEHGDDNYTEDSAVSAFKAAPVTRKRKKR